MNIYIYIYSYLYIYIYIYLFVYIFIYLFIHMRPQSIVETRRQRLERPQNIVRTISCGSQREGSRRSEPQDPRLRSGFPRHRRVHPRGCRPHPRRSHPRRSHPRRSHPWRSHPRRSRPWRSSAATNVSVAALAALRFRGDT